jgi:adenylosuccinate lyase
MSSFDVYDNLLATRYASKEMARLWGPHRKFSTWRRLWLALAEAEKELGLLAEDGVTPRITDAQLAELRNHLDDIDFARADFHEKRLRHDVMAHIHALGEIAPGARDILHLGATSCYVTDNTDLLLMREALGMVRDRLVGVIEALARFAEKSRNLATLGFTHFQPAQLTTVGKRACLWCYDLVLDLHELEHRIDTIRFRGAKGTTGTQASFLALFRGDHAKVRRLDKLVAEKMGFHEVYTVTGQTYSRKVDSQILDALSGVCQSAHKLGTDLRLLAHRQEIDEPFEAEQVGSSAMAYKRNPMRCERMCGLARFVMNLTANAAQTASVQWLERTLDDSVNRRLSLPQAFLGADAVLRLGLNICTGLVVNPDVIRRNVEQMLPYMLTENILMAAVAEGGDRQEIHECIRRHSQDVTADLKAGGAKNDLLDRLRADPVLARVDFERVIAEGYLVGRAPEQVDEFLRTEIGGIRQLFRHLLDQSGEDAISI